MGKAERLEGNVAIVTGGAHGNAIARRLAEEGADVIIGDIDSAAAEKEAAAIDRAEGVSLSLCQGRQDTAIFGKYRWKSSYRTDHEWGKHDGSISDHRS